MPAVANHPDYLLSVFNSVPDNYLLLKPDSPRFTIVAVTDSYNTSTNTTRQGLIGFGIFEAFTDDTSNTAANGVKNLKASRYDTYN